MSDEITDIMTDIRDALVLDPTREIVETGIHTIFVDGGSSRYKEMHHPAGQQAKWFRDELGQVWCKFQITQEGRATVSDHLVHGSRIVAVIYEKDSERPDVIKPQYVSFTI